jgi:hypothetical protein
MCLEKSKQPDWFIAHRSFNINCSSLFLKYHIPWSSSHIKDEVPQGSLRYAPWTSTPRKSQKVGVRSTTAQKYMTGTSVLRRSRWQRESLSKRTPTS